MLGQLLENCQVKVKSYPPNPDWGYGKLDAQAAIVATQATVSIEENSFADLGIQVYPNPAKELLYYRWEDFSGEMAELTVLDLTGRSIQRFTLSNNSGRIQLGALKSGIYILRVKTENKIGVKRLVVN